MSVTRQEAPVRPIGFVIAAAATIAVAMLFWFFERDLIWMAGVLAAGIWVPLTVRKEQAPTKWMLPALIAGVALLVGLGIVVWAT